MRRFLSILITAVLSLSFFSQRRSLLTAAQETQPTPTPETGPSEQPALKQELDPNHLAYRLAEGYPIGSNWAESGFSVIEPFSPLGVDAPPVQAATIAVGFSHSCALSTQGQVKCWGDNYLGQLGDGTTLDHFTPVNAVGLTADVQAISSLHKHTCALTIAGGVKCWGYNLHGEQGDGTTINRLVPGDVVGLTSGVSQIAVGGFHTCALLSSGGIQCWGANWHGQLGDGSTHERHTPVDVIGLEGNVLSIAAGKFHTCALTNEGGIKCWGYNRHGEQGNGATEDRLIPGDVIGLTGGAAALAPGALHTCALKANGSVVCWGDNMEGQIGDGTTTQRLTPVNVLGLNGGVGALKSGAFHSCALLNSGEVKCWGDNWAGQVGDGTTFDRAMPQLIGSLTGLVATVDGGDSHTCAVVLGGEILCWGSNGYGQIGVNTSALRLAPVSVQGLSEEIDAITGGGLHTCVLTSAGGVKCWGNNKYGQLGDGSTYDRLTPVDVTGLSSGVTSISTGGFHSCAAMSGGGVKCWGENTWGYLGDGTMIQREVPVDVVGLDEEVIDLALGLKHSCALTNVGSVKCWGSNFNGRLGDGTNAHNPMPVNVVGLGLGVVQIEAGAEHTCAVMNTGGVNCWGNNFNRQLGDGTQSDRWTPVNVVGLASGVIDVAGGTYHTCALTDQTNVLCWGGNFSGQVGDGSVIVRTIPVDVSGLPLGVIDIAAGGFHSCALFGNNVTMCWGDNWTGQLGDGTTIIRLTPVNVLPLSGEVGAIAAGSQHTCVLPSGAPPVCWGMNVFGQISDGTIPYHQLPVEVVGLTPFELEINYSTGLPGSFFTVTGAHYPSESDVDVRVNGLGLSPSVQPDAAGGFTFFLSTSPDGPGIYILEATSTLTKGVRFTLDEDEPPRPLEGIGLIYLVPPEVALGQFAFLPSLPR
jgi:alpha-tubulin suppressor-like RCC1 family protein